MTTTTLDLGCGASPSNPFHADEVFGVDLHGAAGGRLRAADLAIEPIPFEDNAFDYLSAIDLVGHIPRLVYAPGRRHAFVELMNEAWRVLKPGGHFMIETPAFPHAAAFSDPGLVNVVTEDTFAHYFDDATRAAAAHGFSGAFHVVKQAWQGVRLHTVLRKVAAPLPAQAAGRRVSVFIPVYNGAGYIAQTLDSALAQTHGDFEVLCIDDGSSDGSWDILQQYAARDARIRPIRTPVNQGTAAGAVNYGLSYMSGDYFVYASQDDLFSADWLDKMVARALETGADAVLSDLVMHYPTDPSQDRRISGLRGDRGVTLSGRDAALHSLDWTIGGNALWRASLVKFFRFADFGLNADEFTVRQLYINANKVVFSEGTFFYRQDNANAVTKKMTYKSFDYAYTQLRVYQLLRAEAFAHEVQQQQAIRTVMLRNHLQQWLDTHGQAGFTPEQRQQAEQRLARVTACMKRDPTFAQVA